MITQLVYVSSATQLMSDDELAQLLRKARQKNARLEVSGMLLYKGGNFVQVLEGDASTIDELERTIEADPRHGGMIRLLRRTHERREFAGWSMGFAHADRLEDPQRAFNIAELSPTLDRSELVAAPDKAYKLLMVIQNGMR